MYTILMQDDGTLICTTPNEKLYQTESFCDNIHFILPQQYKDISLSEFIVILKYVNAGNVSQVDFLELNNEAYKESYLEYILPITSKLTAISGNVKLYLTFQKVDSDTQKKYITHSSELSISVSPVKNYFTDENSLQEIDKQILQLQTIASQLSESKADNIKKDQNEVNLTANGEKIGDSITISDSGESSGEFDVVEF